jgi:hypothetical protein
MTAQRSNESTSIQMNRSDLEADDSHAGHDLETGVLARIREWTDVFPWLRLTRTLRVAGSPPLILLVAATFALWRPVLAAIVPLADHTSGAHVLPVGSPPQSPELTPMGIAAAIGQQVHIMIPTAAFDAAGVHGSASILARDLSLPAALGAILWSLVVWTPVVMLLLRQGALLSSGRPMQSLGSGLHQAVRQIPVAWLIAAVPLACVSLLAVMILLIGWVGRITYPVPWFEAILAVVVVVIAIPAGLLVFGANVAVPLGWAAAANERDRDALDSLSRGYEYLMRRPLHLACYAGVSLVILTVAGWLAFAIGTAAGQVSIATLELAGATRSLQLTVLAILGYFPQIVMLTLFWSLVGGSYLLLRFDAGGQEVEDLWMPVDESGRRLPTRQQDR